MNRSLALVKERAVRSPVLFVLLLALATRVAAAILLTATVGMGEFTDTGGYDNLAAAWANGADGIVHQFYFNRLGGYVLPLGVLYKVFGAHLFLGQLLAAVFGAVAAAVVCRLLLEVTAVRWALFGGVVVAVFPSQVLWSAVAYKDSTVWAVGALMALVVAWSVRARGWRLVGYGAALALLLFWMGHLRWPTMIVASWALVLAALLSAPAGRLPRVLGAIAIAALIPWYVGAGAFGVDYGSSFSPAEVRSRNAVGADTAFVDDEAAEDGGFREDIAFLPRGLTVMLLEPYPWTSLGGVEIRLAQAELLLWYPLLIVAAAGIPTLWRKRRDLAFMGSMTGALLIVYALYEGNFGTAFRHRAELVPGLAVMAALGAPVLLGWWQRRATSQPARAESLPSA